MHERYKGKDVVFVNICVDPIPHYILIDKEGRIVSSHASGPGNFQPLFENDEIDVLLK